MKKTAFNFVGAFLMACLFASNVSYAQVSGLPGSATVAFNVVNISKDNSDALQVGARPGDVLRYEVKVTSQTENLTNFVIAVDVSNVQKSADIIDAGLGQLNGTTLEFPPASYNAPCEHVITFFVRVKPDCGKMNSIKASALGVDTMVSLHCENTQVGPSSTITIFAVILIAMMMGMAAFRRRQHS